MNEGEGEGDEDDELANLSKPPTQPEVPQPSTSQPEPSSSLPDPDQSPIGFSPYPSNNFNSLSGTWN